ncbi:hypothetical protein CC78DRAFT_612372 [Lojkania enalia]|uniref:Nuclear pore complex component n=1 Tax=Lojkania enalia TaxID=147567 RepID=A0A9P4NA45_9PLEO|nr:hypothetical protein CC78DRAFT_612372 [Didymosphaeria enalia]
MSAPATPATPITPAGQKQQQPTPTGAWRHPKFDEITRRQYATTFDERNIRIILANSSLLVGTWLVFSAIDQLALLRALSRPLFDLSKQIPYSEWILTVIRALLLWNIGQAFLPLVRRYHPDDIADIPLTPSQRQAMGLDPNISAPQTPGSTYASPQYITPPRYLRTTPRSSFGTPGDRASQSPLSGSPHAGLGKSTSNSPFSPNTGSPLFQKAIGSSSATRRLSYDNRGTPLGNGFFGDSSSSNTPGTPTPGMGKASVGLNNKWLYEKRRGSPRSSLFT